jgi:phosphate starvation-inducible PhoH-like protein
VKPNKHANLILKAIEETQRKESVKPRVEPVRPLTDGQRAYDAAFKSSDIVFGIGCAGTGKTWFAVQRAVEAYKDGLVSKIYVTRPNVDVERGFGFLPGELDEKYAPYLVPLEEAFVEAFGSTHYELLVKNKVIEPVPLAFMRGRTLKNAWVIADEMQNATKAEFLMFLTRIGEGSKYIINGDPAQVDRGIRSGLMDAVGRVGRLAEAKVIRFTEEDVVRHDLVQKIVNLYAEPTRPDYSVADDDENRAGLERVLNVAGSRN